MTPELFNALCIAFAIAGLLIVLVIVFRSVSRTRRREIRLNASGDDLDIVEDVGLFSRNEDVTYADDDSDSDYSDED